MASTYIKTSKRILGGVLATVLVGSFLSVHGTTALGEEPAPEPTATGLAPEAPSSSVQAEPAQEASPEPAVSSPPEETASTGTAADSVSPSAVLITTSPVVGQPVKIRGTLGTTEAVTSWPEVWRTDVKAWSRAASATTDAAGNFEFLLTWGADRPGTQRWRVVGQHAADLITTNELSITRSFAPSSLTPDVKIGQTANLTGSFPEGALRVYGEVWFPAQRRWSRTLPVPLIEGRYTLPLTFMPDARKQSWRAVAEYSDGPDLLSAEHTLVRVSGATINHDGPAPDGSTGYLYGNFPNSGKLRVWPEVWRADGGYWSPAAAASTDAKGGYKLPITWGRDSVGTQRWRMAAQRYGYVEYTREVAYARFPSATLTAPARVPADATVTLRGKFTTSARIRVHGEVWVPSGGGYWSPTATIWTDASGNYSIPTTYGAGSANRTIWRVVGVHVHGRRETTEQRVVTRYLGADPTLPASITRTTAAEVSGYHRSGCPLSVSRLRTIRVNHWDYQGRIQRGTIIVRDDRAQQVAAAFTDMYNAKFPIAQMRLPSAWGGKDELMMAANDTSGYNCRKVVGNPYRWSPHAYGYAVDINPVENPYRDPSGRWWPSKRWSQHRPAGVTGMHYSSSASVRALTTRGWSWGKGWDWHHFERK